MAVCTFMLLLGSAHAASKRIYMMGNSLTDCILYDGFAQLVASSSNTLTQGSQRIPGAPVNWLWGHPADGFTDSPYGTYPTALANYTWDALTLQPFSTYSVEMQYARYFAQALRGAGSFGPADLVPGATPTGNNPNTKIYIYAQWPAGITDTWPSSTWLSTGSATINSQGYFDAFLPQIRSLEPSSSFTLIPVGHILHELQQQIRAGRFPGITRMVDLMLDSRHLNSSGDYVVAVAFYSVIYGADPRGITVPSVYGLTAAQATVVQNAAWKVISRHPDCGFATSLTITTPSLPDCIQSNSFTTSMASALGSGAVTWSVKPGTTLPPGLALSSSGTLSGTVNTVGNYDLSIRATDTAGKVADRDFILFVISNNPPVVSTTTLSSAPYGATYNTLLTYTGGVGDVTWTLTAGDLPQGISLSSTGLLSGAALSVQGNFTLTFRATDSVGGFSEKTLVLGVTAPEAGTLISAPVTTPPVIDGTLSESYWTLQQTANRRLYGTPNNNNTFSVRWDATAIYVAVRVVDSSVIPSADAVHVYLNALHDRQAVFNVDDRHIVVHPNGTWVEVNGRNTGITAAAKITAAGYDIEIQIPFSNLGLNPDGQSLSLGFDLGVEDVDVVGGPSSYQAWLGTGPKNPAPLNMGNLVLAGGAMAKSLLVNGGFDSTLAAPAYPGKATTSLSGSTWQVNGVPSRPFATIDPLGYGYPTKAVVAYGQNPGCCMYQVIADNKSSQGQGVLRFDVKLAASDIAYRLFAYNGTASQVNTLLNTQTQQHPPLGGTPSATLLSGTLGSVPSTTQWREVSLPFNFGVGYDYYVLAFSGKGAGTGSTIDPASRLDNIQLGVVAGEQAVGMSEPASPSLSISAVISNGSKVGSQPLVFRLTRSTSTPFAYPVTLTLSGTASQGVDYSLPTDLFLPGRVTSVDFNVTPIANQIAEGTKTVTLSLASDTAYVIGSPSSASGTIIDTAAGSWYAQYIGSGVMNWTGDSDGDAVPNLMEYALGGNPLSAISAPIPQCSVVSSLNGPLLTLVYTRLRPDLTYVVETSTDLTNWTTSGVDQGTGNPGDTITASFPLDFTSNAKRFLRLRVILNP